MISNGDVVINKTSVKNQVAKFDEEQFQKNKQFFLNEVEQDPDNIPTGVGAIIAMDRNSDGSVKWTFDNIYQNKDLAAVAKDYYGNKTGKTYTDREAIDKFISDRTWKQSNTFSIGKEYKYITGNAGADQKARLAYLTRTWADLPNFYEEGGRGFISGLAANLGVALLDPLNVIGGGIGGIVGKGVVKKAAGTAIAQATKKQTGKKVLEKTTKDIVADPETLADVSAKASKNKILATATTVGAVDAIGLGVADIAAQTTEKEIGLREKLDFKRTGLVSIGAFGTSFLTTAGIAAGTRALRNAGAKQEATNLKPLIEEGAELTDEALSSKTGIKDAIGRNIADQYDFVKILQKNILGVEGSAAGLRAAIESKKFNVDPVLMPYFQLRTAAAASTRSHDFLLNGFYMPPSRTSGSASYIKTANKGLNELLKPFDNISEVNSFLLYAMAKRQFSLVNNSIQLKNLQKESLVKLGKKEITVTERKKVIAKKKEDLYAEMPLTKQEMEKIIDFAELNARDYNIKYKENLKRKGDVSLYRKGLEDLKGFTDDALEYQVQSGLLSKEAKEKILKVNQYFIPFTRKDRGIIKKAIGTIGDQTQRILRTARPGAKRLAKTKQEGEINLYNNLVDYVYKAVNASDRNRAKIALYDMIAQGKKLKQLAPDAVVKKAQPLINYVRVIGSSIEKKYKDAGYKISGPDNGQLPNLEVATFSGTFRESGKSITDKKGGALFDVVYRDGKGEVFEIVSPELQEAFVSFGSRAPGVIESNWFVNAVSGASSWLARISSRAITYSLPFVAFNVIRDTLAATVNSVFGIVNRNGVGFVPGFTSVKELIQSYRLNDEYRKALINGLGYSSRVDSEKFVTQSVNDILKYGAGPETKAYAGTLKKIANIALGKPIWRPYADFVSRVEYASRMGEYKLAKAAGFSEVASSFMGREVATDFGMKGSNAILNVLSRNTMFLNAGLQGLYRTGRLFFEGTVKDRARVVATIGATIVAPEIYLYYANKDLRQYKELNEKIKQLNYCIPTFKDNGSFDGFIFIPKPYDLGFFANAAVAMIKGVEQKAVGPMAQYFLSSFSNVLPGAPVPQIVRPPLELLFNKNFYMGSAVLSAYEKPLISELVTRPSTRAIAVSLNNFLTNMRGIKVDVTKKGQKFEGDKQKEAPFNLNPVKIDYLIRAYMTGLLSYIPEVLNAAAFEPGGPLTEIFGNEKGLKIDKPTPAVDQVDILKRPWSIITRRFFGADVIRNSSFHQEWFRIAEKARKLGVLDLSNINNARKNNSTLISVFDRIQTKIDSNDPLMSKEVTVYTQVLGDTFNSVFEKMQEFRELRKTIELSPSMDPDLKRKKLDQLYNAENIMLKEYLDAVVDMDIDYVLEETMFGITVPTYTGDKEKPKKSKLKLEDFE